MQEAERAGRKDMFKKHMQEEIQYGQAVQA